MPTKRPTKVPPRTKRVVATTPRILSADEKRELILAHAAARRPMDPTQRLTLWVGVSLCLIFIIAGWAYTIGGEIRKTWAQPLDPAIKEALKSGDQIGNEFEKGVSEVSDQLKVMMAQEQILEEMTARLEATSTDALRADLFQATSTN